MKYEPLLNLLLEQPNETVTLTTEEDLEVARAALSTGLRRAVTHHNNMMDILGENKLEHSIFISVDPPDKLHVKFAKKNRIKFKLIATSDKKGEQADA